MDVAIPMNPIAVPPRANGAEQAQGAQGAQGAAEVQAVEAPTRNEAIGQIMIAIDGLIGHSVTGEPGARNQDVKERLRSNAEMMYDHPTANLKTPEAVQSWAKHVFYHDAALRVMTGAANNAGYYAAAQKAAPAVDATLPESVKGNLMARGTLLGMVLGAADLLSGATLGKAASARIYNPVAKPEMYPASVNPDSGRTETKRILMGAFMNTLKVGSRVVAVAGQGASENKADGTIDRNRYNEVDGHMDGAGGMVVGAAHELWQMGLPETFYNRLFLREDLNRVVDKSQNSWGKAAKDVVNAGIDGAQEFLNKFVRNGALTGMFGAFIGSVFQTNGQLDKYGQQSYQDTYGRPLGADRIGITNAELQRLNAGSHITGLMLTMPYVQKAIDALVDKFSTFMGRRAEDAAGQQANPDVEMGVDQQTAGDGVEQPGGHDAIQIEHGDLGIRQNVGQAGAGVSQAANNASGISTIYDPLRHALFKPRCASQVSLSNLSAGSGASGYKTAPQSPAGTPGSTPFSSAPGSPIPSRSASPEPTR
jgi:hypothetical protein